MDTVVSLFSVRLQRASLLSVWEQSMDITADGVRSQPWVESSGFDLKIGDVIREVKQLDELQERIYSLQRLQDRKVRQEKLQRVVEISLYAVWVAAVVVSLILF